MAGMWEKFGVFLPDGTLLNCKYSGQELHGEIVNGAWLISGTKYNSPTTAAVKNLLTYEGYPPNLNGWKIWRVKRPDDEFFICLQELREGTS